MVAPIIEDNRAAIAALCRKHRVTALWASGREGEAFEKRSEPLGRRPTMPGTPKTTDVDFLVDLGPYEPGIAMRYLNLADDLEALMGRSIDLVSIGGLRNNPRLRDELERTRVAIYERDTRSAITF